MVRQNTALVLVEGATSRPLQPVSLRPLHGASSYDEAWLQNLIFANPASIPIGEIAPAFGPLIPICKELDTRIAGPADALFLNALGMPTLVECKLWRNPQARREVVGQIIDYARVLRNWTYVDLQREVARARKEQGFNLAEYIGAQSADPDFSEAVFCDSLDRNLRRGHILLLIVGDGIREGVEAIADYIQETAALHFVLGLVEVAVYTLDELRFIVQPRVLAKTSLITRSVEHTPIATSSSDLLAPEPLSEAAVSLAPEPIDERQEWMQTFWSELISTIKLDDANQSLAQIATDGAIFFYLPPRRQMWITCYFSTAKREIGVFLGMYKNVPEAMAVADGLEHRAEEIRQEFDAAGVTVGVSRRNDGKLMISTAKKYAVLRDPTRRDEQIAWFHQAINAFVNILRPRVQELWGKIDTSEAP